MNGDPNKKSPRTFQCRDALWEKFEQMARELECSVDYLINDAMKQYARQRNYVSSSGGSAGAGNMGAQNFGAPANSGSYRPGPPPSMPPPTGANRLPPPPNPTGGRGFPPPGGGGGRSAPPPPLNTRGGGAGIPNPPPSRGPSSNYPGAPPPNQNARGGSYNQTPMNSAPQGRGAPPPLTGGMGGGANYGAAPSSATLTVIYNGERVGVAKDRFVIGRGKQSSDLTLKDPNVSRQHAMIEFQNGAYFMVDMGSTNGVEFNGQRVARKQIGEGDIFRICDHDLRFTYR
jgi:neural Wiskott-Aldrich syndrome protein